MKFTDENAK